MEQGNERKDIDKKLLFFMAIAGGVVVANIYYIQPLLGEVAAYFGVSSSSAGIAATLTQLGYAIGLFFLLPAADLCNRKKLILITLCLCVASLILMVLSESFMATSVICLCVGITSMVPQLLIPLGAQLSLPENTGKNLGTIISGMLIGILASRVLSGVIGHQFGWKSIYLIAAVLIVILIFVLYQMLPDTETNAVMGYGASLKSLIQLPEKYPTIVRAAVNSAIIFGIFSAFWTTLTFYLGGEQFGYSSSTIGLFGLFGIAGAVLAPVAGKMSDKKGTNFTLLFHMIVIAVSFVCLAMIGDRVIGIIVGVVLLDYGVQCCNVANQARIQTLSENERNRISAIFMVSTFLGGAIGSSAGTIVYANFGWIGFITLGSTMIALALCLHVLQYQGLRQSEANR